MSVIQELESELGIVWTFMFFSASECLNLQPVYYSYAFLQFNFLYICS